MRRNAGAETIQEDWLKTITQEKDVLSNIGVAYGCLSPRHGKNRFNTGVFSLTEYPFRIEFERNFVELRQGGSIRDPAIHE